MAINIGGKPNEHIKYWKKRKICRVNDKTK